MFGIQDQAGNLRNLFKFDQINHSNVLFKLHHQVNFFLVLFGVLFIAAENYLDSDKIKCHGSPSDYQEEYCFLHGTYHITEALSKDIPNHSCFHRGKGEPYKSGGPTINYYVWLPFILALLLVLIKAPRKLWKLLEQGCMENLMMSTTPIANASPGKDEDAVEEFVAKFRKNGAKGRYLLCYTACEVLNLLVVILCLFIVDTLTNGQFMTYGNDVRIYYQNKIEEDSENTGLATNDQNPMCEVFPTIVACVVGTGAIDGNTDTYAGLCILSNNLFNQFYMLVVWYWWVFLIIISSMGLVYRLAVCLIPAFSKSMLTYPLCWMGVDEASIAKIRDLTPAESFVLRRLAVNMRSTRVWEKICEGLANRSRKKNMEMGLINDVENGS